MMKARLIDVVIEQTKQGLLRATSPQVTALHAAGHSPDDLKIAVRAMLEDIFGSNGHQVSAFETDRPEAWVVVPARVAAV